MLPASGAGCPAGRAERARGSDHSFLLAETDVTVLKRVLGGTQHGHATVLPAVDPVPEHSHGAGRRQRACRAAAPAPPAPGPGRRQQGLSPRPVPDTACPWAAQSTSGRRPGQVHTSLASASPESGAERLWRAEDRRLPLHPRPRPALFFKTATTSGVRKRFRIADFNQGRLIFTSQPPTRGRVFHRQKHR